jgi:AcrR family transcriptional regulator
MSDEKLDTEIRQEQIAEAVLSIVAERGVNGLSVAAVARRVGLVPSGIYRHFKNKEEMVMAALGAVERRLMGNVQAAREESDDPIAQLRSLLFRHVRFIREGRAMPRIIFSSDAHSGYPERLQLIQKIIRQYLGRIAELVRQGQQEGKVRGDVDPHTASLMFMGIVVPAAILWHLTDGGIDITQHAQRAWQMYGRMLGVAGS